MKDGGKKLDGSKGHNKAEGQQALGSVGEGNSGFRAIWFSRLLQCKDEPYQFLGGVRYSDVVMLAFGPFLSQIGGENRVPEANVFRGIKKGIAQVTGTSFLHVRVTILELPGLVG